MDARIRDERRYINPMFFKQLIVADEAHMGIWKNGSEGGSSTARPASFLLESVRFLPS